MATGWAWDSRNVKPGDVFLAIRGEHQDGHAFVPSAVAAGAVASIVEQAVDGPHILVTSLTDALAAMALSFRDTFAGPVIGVTGSVGKTSTKEFLAAALSPLGTILKPTGNQNTEYTLPLLWANLEPDTTAVIAEMGMRGFGQIAHLASFCRPTIGVVTNIGISHVELVGSPAGVAKAKGELLQALPADGHAVLPADDEFLPALREMCDCASTTFGWSASAECRLTDYRPVGWSGAVISGVLFGSPWEAEIPALGRHMAANAAAALLAAVHAGVDPDAAAAGLANTELPPMRMEIREFHGGTILLDTYNASPASMLAALEVLGESEVSGRRLAVIGEMRELGAETESAHREVGRALAQKQLDGVLLYGEPTRFVREEAIRAGQSEETIEVAERLADVETYLERVEAGDVVLIKGSRSLELEKAVTS
jgi:UDP-N-acetylmuramoyl-tripeptide--D-alanyl-D-alanine ligase